MNNAIPQHFLNYYCNSLLYLPELNDSIEPVTIKQLDNYIVDSLRVESVFNSTDEMVRSYVPFQRLVYFIDVIDESNTITNCVLVIRFDIDFNIEGPIKDDFSNCYVKRILPPRILESYSPEYDEFFTTYENLIKGEYKDILQHLKNDTTPDKKAAKKDINEGIRGLIWLNDDDSKY